MTEAYLGEIKMFAGTYAPRDWAFCDGHLVAIRTYQELFSLLGTAYGGDGITDFGLPDLRGRLPMHYGTGPGLTPRTAGERFGTENATIALTQIPAHSHPIQASKTASTANHAEGLVLAATPVGNGFTPEIATKVRQYDTNAAVSAGGNQSHPNMMPALCVNFIIAMQGNYPSRN